MGPPPHAWRLSDLLLFETGPSMIGVGPQLTLRAATGANAATVVLFIRLLVGMRPTLMHVPGNADNNTITGNDINLDPDQR